MQTTQLEFMMLALKLAERGRSTVSPNPMVGCVLVKNDQIIGRGFHQCTGSPHAEINALQEAGDTVLGATAYVTLEPCCHYGRTPPCTEALIRAGIKKVVAATLDPNPLMAGKGVEALRTSGIEVEVGLAEEQAALLNEIFFHYIKQKRPFVIAKWAMSLDGKTITQQQDSRQISNHESQLSSHLLRSQVDAILIGSGTAISDDPLLTIRHNPPAQPLLKHPLRIVVCGSNPLPLHLKLFDENFPSIVATTHALNQTWHKKMNKKKCEVWILPKDKNGQVHLPSLLDELGRREVSSVLVEGGNKIHHSFFKENLVNKIHVYLAPVIIAALEKKQPLTNFVVTKHNEDLHLIADFEVNKRV